ncbi:MAG: NAD(P)H-hydrate dehydratase, partial [Bradymonadia bacterium]
MQFHSRRVVSAEEMVALDRFTIDDFGLGEDVLMESAGRCVGTIVSDSFPAKAEVIILFGPGHNGADALVAARYLHEQGRQVKACCPFDEHQLSPACRRQLLRCQQVGIDVLLSEVRAPSQFKIQPDAIYIDGLFGTGLKRPVCGQAGAWIETLRDAHAKVVSIDIPSGVCATSGAIMGTAVDAAVTVTFQHSKIGHWIFPGAGLRGDLRVVDIGIPSISLDRVGVVKRRIASRSVLSSRLPNRPRNGHKGTFGHVAVLGGHQGMTGAAKLAGRTVLRTGAGKATLLCEPAMVERLACELEVLMCGSARCLTRDDTTEGSKPELFDHFDALVIGPGLDCERVSADLSQAILAPCPRVIDAGAITWLAKSSLADLGPECVLTPHPAEAARLLRCSVQTVQSDRFDAVRRLTDRFGCVVVLKGAYTLIGKPDGETVICPFGNSGLGTAGSGDVLGGIIAGLLAQGMPAFEASEVGVIWHALAGER